MEHLAGQYFLNSDLRVEEIREQIKMLCSAGYESIFLHARAGLKTPYFSKQWFDALDAAIDELIKNNAKFAIWDEDNFPSGDAGNRICNSYPELAACQLNFRIIEAEKGKPLLEYFSVNGAFTGCYAVYADDSAADISEHCGTLRSQWNPAQLRVSAYSPYGQLPMPHRRRSMNTPRFGLVWTPDRDCRVICVETLRSSAGNHSSDLLAPETTQILLDLIHAGYERRFGEKMKFCSASFLDEPAPTGNYPWTRRFPEEFFSDHGYQILPLLPHLAVDISPDSRRIRNDYRKTLHRLLCQNYLTPIRQWLNERGIASAGHLTRSEYLSWSAFLWPNELRCFRHLDIPCGDPLGAGVGRPGSIAHHIGLKTISSAARLFGKKAAGADAFAVGGDGISLRDLKFMLNYHLTMGITWYNIHGLYYTLDGERRDEAPPSLFYQHSQWPHMKTFLDYLKKRCEELTGEHVCSLAMLFPSTALQSRLPDAPVPDIALHQTAEELLSRQRDFELIDEETLSEQSPAAFAALRPFFLLAHADVIEEKTARWLEEYAACGGKLFVAGVVPELLPSRPGEAAGKWLFAEKCCVPDYISQIPAPEIKGNQPENILIRKIRKEGRERLFLFNRSRETFRGTCGGIAVEIAPGEAGFADELCSAETAAPLPLPELDLSFGPNCVPLASWGSSRFLQIDLLAKHLWTQETVSAAESISTCFDIGSMPETLAFVTEETTLERGSFELNGFPLETYSKADFRDCRELTCDISSLVKTGRNTLVYRGRMFENAPYLRGEFKVQLIPGSFPLLTKAERVIHLPVPRDFSTLGYGTFSGTAVYDGCFSVASNGKYRFDMHIEHDSLRVIVDGKTVETLIAPPYRLTCDLASGLHTLRLELCCAPGNRDVMASLPAGLQ